MQAPSFELHCYSCCQMESLWPVALAKQFWAMCKASAKTKWLWISEASESQQLKSSVGRTYTCEWRVVCRSPQWGNYGHVSTLDRPNNMGKCITVVFFSHKNKPLLSFITWQNSFCDCWKYRQGIAVFLSICCVSYSVRKDGLVVNVFQSTVHTVFLRVFFSLPDLELIFFFVHSKLFCFHVYYFALLFNFPFLFYCSVSVRSTIILCVQLYIWPS